MGAICRYVRLFGCNLQVCSFIWVQFDGRFVYLGLGLEGGWPVFVLSLSVSMSVLVTLFVCTVNHGCQIWASSGLDLS